MQHPWPVTAAACPESQLPLRFAATDSNSDLVLKSDGLGNSELLSAEACFWGVSRARSISRGCSGRRCISSWTRKGCKI
eukprot:164895-Rhodomonas_salina.1